VTFNATTEHTRNWSILPTPSKLKIHRSNATAPKYKSFVILAGDIDSGVISSIEFFSPSVPGVPGGGTCVAIPSSIWSLPCTIDIHFNDARWIDHAYDSDGGHGDGDNDNTAILVITNGVAEHCWCNT
jgi:hypothetical protein